MGKRRNEQPPGKFQVPKTKRSLQEDLEAAAAKADDGPDATGPAQTGDADGKATSPALTAPGSAATDAPRSVNGDGEAAAPERSRAAEHVPSPSPQEGPDTGIGGGGKAPEAASPPQSPRQVDSVPEETGEDEPMASTEQHGSAGEVLDAETQTDGGTGDTGDGPERGCAALVQGEAAAGGEVALPADTPGSTGMPAEMPDPHCEDGNRGERPGGTDQCQEPPCASVSAEDGEPGTVSERAAGGEHWESAAEGGSAEAENTGAAGTQGGNVAPRKNLGEADAGREEAGGGETPAAGSSSAPDPAVPAGGKREGEGLAEEGGAKRPELRGGNGLRLPPQQPLPDAERCHGAAVPGHEPCAAAGRSRAEEAPPPLAEGNGPEQPQPWEDASDVVCGLILELSNLNRLAMSAHRGLGALRKPRGRRSRWPVPASGGRRWKEP